MDIDVLVMVAEFQCQLGILGTRAAEYRAIAAMKDRRISELEKEVERLSAEKAAPS